MCSTFPDGVLMFIRQSKQARFPMQLSASLEPINRSEATDMGTGELTVAVALASICALGSASTVAYKEGMSGKTFYSANLLKDNFKLFGDWTSINL